MATTILYVEDNGATSPLEAEALADKIKALKHLKDTVVVVEFGRATYVARDWFIAFFRRLVHNGLETDLVNALKSEDGSWMRIGVTRTKVLKSLTAAVLSYPHLKRLLK